MIAALDNAVRKFSAWADNARANRLFSRGLAGAAAITLLDQATKYWVVDILRLPERAGGHIEISRVFDLTFVQNRGASFGMLAGGLVSRVFLSALSVGVALLLVKWLAGLSRLLAATGVALIIGGAIGNLIDRALYGHVVDFLDFSGLYFPWVFNVADAAINIGVGLLAIDWLREHRAMKGDAR